MNPPELSIIIPAYNEEALITSTLDGLEAFLSARPETYELIVVDDGSQDQTSRCIREWQEKKRVNLHLLTNETNMGKGFSIRRGVMESRGGARRAAPQRTPNVR